MHHTREYQNSFFTNHCNWYYLIQKAKHWRDGRVSTWHSSFLLIPCMLLNTTLLTHREWFNTGPRCNARSPRSWSQSGMMHTSQNSMMHKMWIFTILKMVFSPWICEAIPGPDRWILVQLHPIKLIAQTLPSQIFQFQNFMVSNDLRMLAATIFEIVAQWIVVHILSCACVCNLVANENLSFVL